MPLPAFATGLRPKTHADVPPWKGSRRPRGPARCAVYLSAHTKRSQKAGPSPVARLRMDLPFRNRQLYSRVHSQEQCPPTCPRPPPVSSCPLFRAVANCPAHCAHGPAAAAAIRHPAGASGAGLRGPGGKDKLVCTSALCLPSWPRHCLCHVFAAKAAPLPCVPTAVAANRQRLYHSLPCAARRSRC